MAYRLQSIWSGLKFKTVTMIEGHNFSIASYNSYMFIDLLCYGIFQDVLLIGTCVFIPIMFNENDLDFFVSLETVVRDPNFDTALYYLDYIFSV